MIGDNIYHRIKGLWKQANSHHSNPDGTPNRRNLQMDTKVDRVLVSRHFLFFGKSAPPVPADVLASIGFKNCRGHFKKNFEDCSSFFDWLYGNYRKALNQVLADPHDFAASEKRFLGDKNRIQ